MSGLLERIARRRRALSEQRLQPLSGPESNGLPVGPDRSAGSMSSVNGTSTNGVDPIGHFVDAALLPADTDGGLAHADSAPEAAGPAPEAAGPAPDAAGPAPDADGSLEESEAPTSEFGAVALEQVQDLPSPREQAPPVQEPERVPDLGERAGLRRRARYLQRLREIQLRDIGGLLVELHRFGRDRPDLVKAKVEIAAETASELREIESVLSEGRSLRELREAGIGGACAVCGAVHGSRDRFCASCGEPLGRPAPDPPAAVQAAGAEEPPEREEAAAREELPDNGALAAQDDAHAQSGSEPDHDDAHVESGLEPEQHEVAEPPS